MIRSRIAQFIPFHRNRPHLRVLTHPGPDALPTDPHAFPLLLLRPLLGLHDMPDKRPVQKQHRAPVLHMQRKHVWQGGSRLPRSGRADVEAQVLWELEVPLVEQALERGGLEVSARGRPYGVDCLQDEAQDVGCIQKAESKKKGIQRSTCKHSQRDADALKHDMLLPGTPAGDRSPRAVSTAHSSYSSGSSSSGSVVSKSHSKIINGRPMYVDTYLSMITHPYHIRRRSLISSASKSRPPRPTRSHPSAARCMPRSCAMRMPIPMYVHACAIAPIPISRYPISSSACTVDGRDDAYDESSSVFARSRYSSPALHMVLGSAGCGGAARALSE